MKRKRRTLASALTVLAAAALALSFAACSGSGDYGGDDSKGSGGNWASVSTSSNNSLAIKTDGSLWARGPGSLTISASRPSTSSATPRGFICPCA